MPVRIENMTEPIPGYRLLERLGRGGFGEVWKAEAPGGLHKAIKFVYGDLSSPRDGVAAEQELKALSRVKSVRHPFILSLERYDIIDGQLIIVSELADRNLYERFVECRSQGQSGIPRAELLRYMEEAAEALDLMNSEHQLQHLDIKPQNLFLIHNHIKVGDFGLVKDMEGMQASVTGGVTPLYAAPETFDGWISRYSDQYSLAIVYQELLTGQRPFPGTNARQLVLQHLTAPPDLSPLPPGDREPIGRALSKTPEQRFACCADLIRALRTGGATEAVPGSREVPGLLPRHDTDSDSSTDSHPPSPIRVSPAQAAMVASPPRPRPIVSPVPRPLSDSSASTHPSVPPEFQGDGVLLPAIVIGVGELGLGVLQRLREAMQARFGSSQALPHLRLLYIDTDPQTAQKATEGSSSTALLSEEILLTRLRRASHYIKQQEGLHPLLKPWLDAQMVFRIPRSQLTTGLRSLGRLAFFDNYRAITGRLEREIEACTAPDALATADRETRLGLRSNRPRVYIVAGLAGGTGSGMFLDLAYVTRQVLQRIGYAQPDVVGLLLLPAVERNTARTVAMGNVYAALTELNHFSAPETAFSAKYDAQEEPLTDSASPFNRCVLLPLDWDDEASSTASNLGAGLLFHDLLSPMGRAADLRRAKSPPRALATQTFGLYRLCWPRPALATRLAQRLCRRLVQSWMARDGERLRPAIEKWVAEQWTKRELGVGQLLEPLANACQKALRETPESAFDMLIGQLTPAEGAAPDLDVQLVTAVLKHFEQLLGRPDDESRGLHKAMLVDALDVAVREITARAERRLGKVAVCLIEQPQYRLAGAEEAIRLISAQLQRLVEEQGGLGQKAGEQAALTHEAIRMAIENVGTAVKGKPKSPLPTAAELLEMLRQYPRLRYQSLLLQRVTTVYRSLLANCADYQREFSFCRTRLGELLQSIEGARLADAVEIRLGPSRKLLPPGCRTLSDVADRFLRQLPAEEMLAFEDRIQEVIRSNFRALVSVCMAAGNVMKDLMTVMHDKARAFAEAYLGHTTVADVFEEQYGGPESAAAALLEAFADAEPPLPAPPSSVEEFRVVVVPRHTTEEALRAEIVQLMPATIVVSTTNPDDIVCYREQGVQLGDLPQLGATAQEAYSQMAAVAHYTAHSRMDISLWFPIAR
jgi:serine/threonine protein kinase